MKTPLLLLHGFTGSPKSYRAVRALLAESYEVLSPALSGHAGRSFDDVRSFDDELARLLTLLDGAKDVVLCGYSLGARLALGLLAKDPTRFSRALLIAVHPGLSAAERAERRESDARWAALLREPGLAEFLELWTKQPLFASQSRLAADVLEEQRALRKAHDPEGLALALERLGLGSMPSYWPSLPTLTMPITLAVGELDQKFVEIAQKAARELPAAKLLIAPGAGHNLLLERPDLVARHLNENQP